MLTHFPESCLPRWDKRPEYSLALSIFPQELVFANSIILLVSLSFNTCVAIWTVNFGILVGILCCYFYPETSVTFFL